MSTDLIIDLFYALGIGLFIGLEREHHEVAETLAPTQTAEERGVAIEPNPLGARTFALLAVLGWAAGVAGESWPWLAPLIVGLTGALVAIQYVIVRVGVGLTTEVAALLTVVLGLLVNTHRPLAVALALVTTLLLVSKPLVATLVVKLRRIEITATLQLAILLAIVLPLLPTEARDPWGALPPRSIGLFVVLIAGIGFVGYALSRILGPRRGAGLTGVIGGLTSSTAVTIAMSKAGRDESMRHPGQLAVLLANTIMFGRVLVVAAVINPDVLETLTVPMASMGVVMLVSALRTWLLMRREEVPEATGEPAEIKNPFALIPALKWGAALCAVLVGAALAQKYFGDNGFLAAAGISGLTDVDAITIAAVKQSGEGTLSLSVAALAITIAVMANTLVKGGFAVAAGGFLFGRPIAITFLAAMAVGLATALLL